MGQSISPLCPTASRLTFCKDSPRSPRIWSTSRKEQSSSSSLLSSSESFDERSEHEIVTLQHFSSPLWPGFFSCSSSATSTADLDQVLMFFRETSAGEISPTERSLSVGGKRMGIWKMTGISIDHTHTQRKKKLVLPAEDIVDDDDSPHQLMISVFRCLFEHESRTPCAKSPRNKQNEFAKG